MRAPFIFLCSEITRHDAASLMNWLRDDEVRRYLSDAQDVSDSMERLLERVSLPVLTHLFSGGGRFYMVYGRHNRPMGFVRLVVSASETEIVLVIGERASWGKGLGSAALREALRIAFFELRSPKVVANIRNENVRSLRAFKSAGFASVHQSPHTQRFTLTLEDYLAQAQRRAAMENEIRITPIDRERLLSFLDEAQHAATVEPDAAKALLQEINRAKVIDAYQIPANVVTMRSRALLLLNGAEMETSLVYPHEADWQSKRVSVLSPIGTAILGYAEGESVRWQIPTGMAEIKIQKLLYQPEAAGDYHL